MYRGIEEETICLLGVFVYTIMILGPLRNPKGPKYHNKKWCVYGFCISNRKCGLRYIRCIWVLGPLRTEADPKKPAIGI